MSMEMEMTGSLDMRPSPTLVAFTQILQLSGLELSQAISQEVQSNPALEVEEREICPLCGEPTSVCTCSWSALPEQAAGGADGDEEFDLLTIVAGQVTLEENLLREVSLLVPSSEYFIVEYIVGSLDDKGFLDSSPEEIAQFLGVSVERVSHVLSLIQMVGPLGVGARDVQECLDLQLRRWEEQELAHPLARAIVERYLTSLGEGRYGQIARGLGVSIDTVIEARDFIRAHLRPYPIADLSELETWARPSETPYVAPDVVIREIPGKPGEFEVEVVESRRFSMRVAPFYQSLARQETAARTPGMNSKEREQVQGYVTRARSFLAHVRERRETMRRVAEYVAERQKEFLRHGTRYLKPLTRAEVAEAIGLHESTVSRATANKYVMLPWRQVVPFSHFFQASLSVRDVLKEIIQSENKPLTDAQLVDKLAARGYHVARRTVAKYRDQLGILPSSLR